MRYCRFDARRPFMGGVASGRYLRPGFKGGITLADLVHVLPFQSVSAEAQEALSKI